MSIPLVQIARQHEELGDEIRTVLDDVIARGDFIRGADVTAFEEEFADYCEVEHAIGVGNGGDALTLALKGLGIGSGDEVITAANTFVATALAIRRTGATPVFVDHDPDTYTLDPRKMSAAITERTKGVVPVHLYGHPADMDAIGAIAAEHDLIVVEDACQAHGARYKGKRCGSLGHAAAFSFYPSKNLGAIGDGGAVVTHNEELAQWIRASANYGAQDKYEHTIAGSNSRLDTIHAAILRVKLRYLDEWNESRRWLASKYCEALSGVEGIVLPRESRDAEPVYHLFVVRIQERDRIAAALQLEGVGVGIHYPIPLHHQPVMVGSCIVPERPVHAETNCSELLSLPLCPQTSLDDVDFVTQKLIRFVKQSQAVESPDKVFA